jgi:5-methyltetrahydrofolate--homocysteine methyltransferase
MSKAVEEIQEVVSTPLCLDSSLPSALEAGLKACAGKPIINSVNGENEKLKTIIPLAKRYGAALIGLTTDEKGIPKTASERISIAGKIIDAAKTAGIPEREIVIDYLTLAASAAPGQAQVTLDAIIKSKKNWPTVKTILGVSNISFGLPARQIINSTFLKMAVKAGLDMAILNPFLDWNTDDELARALLTGSDPDGAKFIAKYSSFAKKPAPVQTEALPADKKLYTAVIDGNREEIQKSVQGAIDAGIAPLNIANDIILKALNEVGEKFSAKEYFLPQVIRSAETAQSAFSVIKPMLKKDAGFVQGKIVLATVKGDVHDIGKNIVAAVLESHGWEVIDLGKNIEAKDIVEAALKHNAPVIGLSALMTTTMPEMEKVVLERNARKAKIKVLIGGAPVTVKYAKEIGADGYAKDAVTAAKAAAALL